ncbi:MAG: holo-ACP synthase [Actinomycetota bacterium]
MEVVGLGVDLVDVERVARILKRRTTFVRRVFTPKEIEYCERQANPAESYAARWGAREACRKALGGIRNMRWHDVRVDRAASGAPRLVLEGSSRARADALGVSEVMVALTHERRMAAAFCVAIRH